MVKTIPALITELKATLTDGLDACFDKLEQYLSPQANAYNDFLHLKAMFKKAQKDKLLGLDDDADTDITFNRVRSALLNLIDELKEEDIAAKEIIKKGQLLYHIPAEMMVKQATKCLVRLAVTKELLLQDLQLDDQPAIEDIRISKVMSVDLIDVSNNQFFKITAINSSEQYIEEEEFTEWNFYVTPLQTGNYPLLLKVTTVQIINQRERKKEIVLEKMVNILTQVVSNPDEIPQNLEKYESALTLTDSAAKPAEAGTRPTNPKSATNTGTYTSAPSAPSLPDSGSAPRKLQRSKGILLVIVAFFQIQWEKFLKRMQRRLNRFITYIIVVIVFVKYGLKKDLTEMLGKAWDWLMELLGIL